MDLQGKTSVITGAAQGLGQKMAGTVASKGANVALIDVDHARLKDSVRLCSKPGLKVIDYVADVTDELSIAALFDKVVKDFGSVDLIINNAGMVKIKDGKIQDKMSLAQLKSRHLV